MADKAKKIVKKSTAAAARASGIAGFLNAGERHKLNRLVLMSRYVVEGNLAGAHRSPLRGASSEFADHKAYGTENDPKHLDWRVLARTDKYYIKRFEDETNLRVYIVLDRSKSMAYGSEQTTKYEYACRLAAALGYVVVKARDSVGLFLHSEKIDATMDARNSFSHLNDLCGQLQAFEPDNKTGIADALHHMARSIRRRALIVVISDLLGDEKEINLALAHLRKQHHDVIVFHVLDPMEIDLGFKRICDFEDLETGERITVDARGIAKAYKEIFGAFIDQYRQACAQRQIDYRIVRTDSMLDNFVRAYLLERVRLSR